ncbi:MAG TPA: hypothetical protein VFN09_08760, partial [Rhodanobacteraceae bacterium]|nr:hypothetical protein [Rhodanobacteraceae bacterium]
SKLAHGAKSVADGASTTGDVIEIAYETAVLPSVKLGMLGRVGKWFSRLIKPAEREAAAFPKNASQIGHIFRDAPGHLPDTAASRKLLSDVASNPSNKVGVDRFGNTWSASTRADGTQVWVSTRDGVIQNGGLNKVPKTEFPTIIEP